MKIIVCFIVSVWLLSFVSCKKSGDTTSDPELKTDSTTLKFAAEPGGVDSFHIFYSGRWDLTILPSSISWLKTSIVGAKGNASVSVTTEERNTTGAPRIATLVITPDGNTSKTVNISVLQAKEKQWEGIAVFPGVERAKASSFVIGEKFYVGMGTGIKNNIQQDLSDCYEYNTVSNAWRQIADFPGGARELASGFSLNGKGYIAKGQRIDCPTTPGLCNFTYFKDFWEYDPINNSWKNVATFDFLSSNVIGSDVFTINNKAYINVDNKLWEFNPVTYLLVDKGFSPSSVYVAAFSLNNKGYIGTGGNFLRDFYEYDPQTGKWTKMADFGGEGRYGAIGFSLKGKGYIGAGMGKISIGPGTTQEVRLKDVWEFNPQTNAWIKFVDIPQTIVHGVAGVINQKAIVGTGNAFNLLPFATKDFWFY